MQYPVAIPWVNYNFAMDQNSPNGRQAGAHPTPSGCIQGTFAKCPMPAGAPLLSFVIGGEIRIFTTRMLQTLMKTLLVTAGEPGGIFSFHALRREVLRPLSMPGQRQLTFVPMGRGRATRFGSILLKI
jgi:hypothetical protein